MQAAGSREWGRQEPHRFPLIHQWDAHVVMFTKFVWFQFSQGHNSDVYVSNPNTSNTTVSIADSPNNSYFKAFTTVQKSQTTELSLDSKQTTMITVILWQSNMKPINSSIQTCHDPNVWWSSSLLAIYNVVVAVVDKPCLSGKVKNRFFTRRKKKKEEEKKLKAVRF